MIRSEVTTDDGVMKAEFDATPYFEKLDDEGLQQLAGCDFTGDYPADHVAQGMAGQEPKVQALFDYLDARNAVGREKTGFEVTVNPSDALTWIARNRPKALPDLQERLEDEGIEELLVTE